MVEHLAVSQTATGVTASNETQTTVDLAWTLPQQPGVTVSAVEVVWDVADGAYRYPWNTETLAANATSHTVTGLTAGTAYSFFVRLVTSSGNPSSDMLSVSTLAADPSLSVADAEGNEGAGAAITFAVTLDRAASGAVTVEYATADGTATAGEDYTATSGTLTFAAGVLSQSVAVALLDDAIDEGRETFTLQLSNATGAQIADSEATGTIINSDSMPKAWTARFGRSVAVHVVDAVEQRLEEQVPSESWAQVGGHQLAGGADVMESMRRLAPDRDLWAQPDTVGAPGQDMTPRQLLLGSAFHLVSNGEGEAAVRG